MRKFFSAVILFCLSLPALSANDLRLAATYTLEDSGILPVLTQAFEKKYQIKIKLVIGGTGQVLKFAENGDVDVVMSHSKPDEEKLVASGYGIKRFNIMYNDFLIAGPAKDPAHIHGVKDSVMAFKKIYEAKSKFISRGDDSGTHKKEKSVWLAAGISPNWDGYLSAGLGMGKVLAMADELQAYVLVDRATFSAYKNKIDLVALSKGDPRLFNEYAVIAVNPAKYPDVNKADAGKFVSWITSVEGQNLIAGFKINNQQVFFPNAKSN